MVRRRALVLPALFALAACQPTATPDGIVPTDVDFLLVDKSDGTLAAYLDGELIKTYRDISFGDAPSGHKQFEGDERTPEGRYTIDARNPNSAYHLSLRISYPNAQDRAYAEGVGRSPGGDIFIHGQPNRLPMGKLSGDWTDGCIAVSNDEIKELWDAVPNGTPIEIRP
ncbi:L,D-transpeptidase family protein [Pontixanthobacter sp. CEM42]|uniref:L,D-transpeptidase family protein n=1 Tax=Pontixanthobacter sp. CEM42 TaxID=2792077 RepID=UPI001AE0C581|nr:L,D-transpeptidase family protein [Pontixanthobacter sp. CEM42]